MPSRQQGRAMGKPWARKHQERRFRARINAIIGSPAANRMRISIAVKREKAAAR